MARKTALQRIARTGSDMGGYLIPPAAIVNIHLKKFK